MDKYIRPYFSKSVLITIDTQNDFTLDDAPAQISGTKEIIPNMSRLVNVYRDKGLLIIHVIRLYKRDGSNVDLCRKDVIEQGKEIVLPDSRGAELVAELMPDKAIGLKADELLAGKFQPVGTNEFVMYKPRWGAFYGTNLEMFLRQRTIDTLVFCGCNFPNCPRTSIYEASERDFRVVLIKDAVSGLYPRGEEEMKNIGVHLYTTKDIEKYLAGTDHNNYQNPEKL